jgi:hypothetical protein
MDGSIHLCQKFFPMAFNVSKGLVTVSPFRRFYGRLSDLGQAGACLVLIAPYSRLASIENGREAAPDRHFFIAHYYRYDIYGW